jgi:hypothetical protein
MDACRDKVENKMLLLETQMMNKIDQLQRDMVSVKGALNELLTRKEFEPYRLVIMGLIGGVLMAVLAGLMALVIGK